MSLKTALYIRVPHSLSTFIVGPPIQNVTEQILTSHRSALFILNQNMVKKNCNQWKRGLADIACDRKPTSVSRAFLPP